MEDCSNFHLKSGYFVWPHPDFYNAFPNRQRIYSSDHQMMIIPALRKLISEKNIKLIVVDSLINHFRSEFIGKGTIAERQQKLNLHIHELIRLVESFPEVVLVVTNQVSTNPDVFFGDPTRPAGGNIVAHAAAIRVYLRKGKGEQRVAKLIDAPHLPEDEVTFSITENGVRDFMI